MPGNARIRLLLEARDLASTTVGRVTRGLGDYKLAAAGAVGVAASLAAAGVAITANYLEQADALGKLSTRTGQQTDELGALLFAFEQADLSASDLERTFTRLKQAGENIDDVADRFRNLEDQTERTNYLVGLFGERLGPRLATVLAQGSEGLAAYRREHERLNLTIDQESARAAERFNDNLDTINRAAAGVANQIAMRFVGWASPIAESLVEELPNIQRGASDVIGVIEGIGTAANNVISRIYVALEGLGEALRDAVEGGPFESNTAGSSYADLIRNDSVRAARIRDQALGNTGVAGFNNSDILLAEIERIIRSQDDYARQNQGRPDRLDFPIGDVSARIAGVVGGERNSALATYEQWLQIAQERGVFTPEFDPQNASSAELLSRTSELVAAIQSLDRQIERGLYEFSKDNPYNPDFYNAYPSYPSVGRQSPVPVDLPATVVGGSGGIRIDGASLADTVLNVRIVGFGQGGREGDRTADFSVNDAGQLENRAFSDYLESLQLFGEI